MRTFSEIAGTESFDVLRSLPYTPGISSNLNFDDLLSNGETIVMFKGVSVKLSVEKQVLDGIRLKCIKFYELKEASVKKATSVDGLAQLGGVRGVPGAVGAASGVAAAVGTIITNEDYSQYTDYIITGITSLVSGGLATLCGYQLAGFLGRIKHADLEKKMKIIAEENFEPKFLTEIKNILLTNMRFEIVD